MNMIHSKSASGYKRTCYFTYTLPHPKLPKRDEWTRYRLMLDHVTVLGVEAGFIWDMWDETENAVPEEQRSFGDEVSDGDGSFGAIGPRSRR